LIKCKSSLIIETTPQSSKDFRLQILPNFLIFLCNKNGGSMSELVKMAKDEYDTLSKQLADREKEVVELKKKLYPIGVFLKELGVLEKDTRKRDKK